jgi:hypothetical protein
MAFYNVSAYAEILEKDIGGENTAKEIYDTYDFCNESING